MRIAALLMLAAACAACRAGDTTAPAESEALEFVQQPLQVAACERIAPLAVRATANGALASGLTGSITVSIVSGTGTPLAVLSGTRTMPIVGGVATFTDLALSLPGADYRLAAAITTSPAAAQSSRASLATQDGVAIFADAVSGPISVVAGGPTQLAFTTNPSNALVGVTLAPIRVTVRDACAGNVNNASNLVTIALSTNANGGELVGTTTVTAVNGIATFSNLWVTRPGAGYTFVATSPGLNFANSNAFTIAGVP